MPDSPPPTDAPPLLRPATRRVIAALLLIVGLQLWLVAGRGYWQDIEPRILAILLVLCCIPPLTRRLTSLLDRLHHPRPRTRLLIALLLAIGASAYILHDAHREHRSLAPRYPDESVYLIQTQMYAHGHLWLPAHPLADFFDSFQIITRPVYASIYFPGAAMMFVPGVWLGLPGYAMPLLYAGLAVGLLYLLVTHFFDDHLPGLIAALMLLSLPIFRRMATKPMAQIPELLLSLLAISSYLAWRRHKRWPYAALTGLFLSFSAVTRPVDALCVAIPIAIAVLLDLLRPSPSNVERSSPPTSPSPHLPISSILFFLLPALPFLALQLTLNLGITGHPLQTPFRLYLDRDLPGTQFGFHPLDPSAHPLSPLPQKQEYYQGSTLPDLTRHTPLAALHAWLSYRLPTTLEFTLPHPLLLTLLPLGLLAITPRRRWVLASVFPLFVAFYYFYPFFFPHYALLAAPSLILLTLASVDTARVSFPRLAQPLSLFLLSSIAALTLMAYHEFNRHTVVDPLADTQLTHIDRTLSALPGRSIVLFHYPGHGNYELEPVYNTTTPNPDDAHVIRAHDLGPNRNPTLFRYYAALQPDRTVYRYDRATDTLTPLGNVKDLASPPSSTLNPPSSPPSPSHNPPPRL